MIDLSEKIFKLTDDGIQLEKSVLWLDSKKNGSLSFVSSALECPYKTIPKIITTEATLKISKHLNKEKNALLCQYNRPFSLGRNTLELLPSGVVLGGSSLLVEFNKKKILYAPQLTLQKSELDRKLHLREADILILKATHPFFARTSSSHKKVFEALASRVLQCLAQNTTPIILAPLLPTGPELTLVFNKMGIPLSVHRDLYKINKVFESYGNSLGSFNLVFSPKTQKNRAIILPRNYRFTKNLSFNSKFSVFLINSSLDYSNLIHTDNSVELDYSCSKTELTRNIKSIKPQSIFIFGPYAHKLSQSLKDMAPVVKTLFPHNQSPLIS